MFKVSDIVLFLQLFLISSRDIILYSGILLV